MMFIKNNDTKMITNLFDVDDMLLRFQEVGLIDSISNDYGENISDMCNNTTMYFGSFLMNVFGLMVKNLIVHEGVFNMQGNHTWLQLDNYIIDVSLAQFYSKAPCISFLDISTKEYVSCMQYSFEDWIVKIGEEE